jgi:hypothetical protein
MCISSILRLTEKRKPMVIVIAIGLYSFEICQSRSYEDRARLYRKSPEVLLPQHRFLPWYCFY